MAFLWEYTEEEFQRNYEIDLGEGVRASFVHSDNDTSFPVGILFAHHRQDSNSHTTPVEGFCAGTIFWTKPFDEYEGSLWELNNLEPLDLSPSIQCDCGLHGFIKDGRWLNA